MNPLHCFLIALLKMKRELADLHQYDHSCTVLPLSLNPRSCQDKTKYKRILSRGHFKTIRADGNTMANDHPTKAGKMLKVQTLIFSILTVFILSNYAMKAIDEVEEHQKLSLEGKIAFLLCYNNVLV